MTLAPPDLAYAFNEGSGNSIKQTFGPNAGSTTLGVASGTALAWTTNDGLPALGRTEAGGTEGGAQVALVSNGLPTGVGALTSFTVGCRVRPMDLDGSPRGMAFVMYSGTAGGADWCGLGFNVDGQYEFYLGTQPGYSTTVLSTTQPSSLIAVWENGELTCYLDGVEDKSDALTGIANLTRLHFSGADWEPRGVGLLQDWFWYSRALTPAEVLEASGYHVATWPEPEEPTPLATPTVTITGKDDPTAPAAADGSVTVSWPAVPNAASYDAMIANSATPAQGDFVLHEAGVTSPYVFEDQGQGTRAYGIIARAS